MEMTKRHWQKDESSHVLAAATALKAAVALLLLHQKCLFQRERGREREREREQ